MLLSAHNYHCITSIVMEHKAGKLSEQVGDVQNPNKPYSSDQRKNESLLISLL